jgi:hypothetical protein
MVNLNVNYFVDNLFYNILDICAQCGFKGVKSSGLLRSEPPNTGKIT